MPERLQLSRRMGYRKPEGAIVVARPSRWGNPFPIGEEVQVSVVAGEIAMITMTRAMAVDCYRDLMRGRLRRDPDDHPDDAAYVQRWHDGLAELRGHDLACWCPLDQPCHADVLLELANGDNHA